MILRLINKLNHYLEVQSIKLNIDLTKLRIISILWCATVTVMWLYVLFSYFSFGGWGPVAIGGLICTIIHSLCPIIFIETQSLKFTGFIISITGFIFQVIFCIYSGGVFSPSAIWFSLHPVILAFFADISLIAVSISLNSFTIIGLYLAEIYGMLPPDSLPKTYRYAMNITSFIGVDLLIALFSILTVYIYNKNTKIISEKKDMIENLVRILSHDLNNPLTISNIQIYKFKKGKISAETAFEKIGFSNNQIHEIVNSVRYWLAHQEGKLMLKNENILCVEIIDHVKNSFSDRMEQKNINFIVQNDLEEKQQITGDRNAILFQIINNILSNAIKFSPTGSNLKMTLTQDNSYIIISILDEGKGVDEDLKKKIFSVYEHTTTKGTSGESGTGFGMPIVKTLMDKMQGLVSIDNWYENDIKRGAIVILKFPIPYQSLDP